MKCINEVVDCELNMKGKKFLLQRFVTFYLPLTLYYLLLKVWYISRI